MLSYVVLKIVLTSRSPAGRDRLVDDLARLRDLVDGRRAVVLVPQGRV